MLPAMGKGLNPLPLVLGGNLPAKQTPVATWTGVEMLPWSSQQRWSIEGWHRSMSISGAE